MPRNKFYLLIVIVMILFFSCKLYAAGSKRVLIVTTEQYLPEISAANNGMNIITDLAAAGYPFDVVSYNRFIKMVFNESDDHDIVILNGHTSPVEVSLVASKCRELFKLGRKIFINGHLPYSRFDEYGKLSETVTYCTSLFNLKRYESRWLHGKAVIPEELEKDKNITSFGQILKRVNTFELINSPSFKVTLNGRIIGFLFTRGGAIDGESDYILNLLDYGKVVSYLRYGNTSIIGFANDRIEGKPIVSFEVHCDSTSNLSAIDKIEYLANKFQIPLVNLIVQEKLNQSSIEKWNSAACNSLISIGSHSRTHPMQWPSVSDFYAETSGALNSQRKIIPSTGNYFNFSGSMNPTMLQIDELYLSNTIFGAKGGEIRWVGLPFGLPWQHFKNNRLELFAWKIIFRLIQPAQIQLMPTSQDWFIKLSNSTTTPYCLSQTLPSDYQVLRNNLNLTNETKKYFNINNKYGLYSYGYIHDYSLDPKNPEYQTNGVHMFKQIETAFSYLSSQNVNFVETEFLIKRLRDFISGWIDYDNLPDGIVKITAHRKLAKANQVKVNFKNKLIPIASGKSVLKATYIMDKLYIDLKPEIESSFNVRYVNTDSIR